ncbi:MAG TPA: RNA-dependent DNA polymerase [Nitrospiraceae bacterium]|nr:RNA-dependent DNA polymerase [Nitrospiraceae bacterium]
MRRHNNLYSRIYNFENLLLAFRKASRGRRFAPEVLRFQDRLEENLINLQDELVRGTYKPSPYRTFTIYEPKERIIHVAPFRDRVVHHAIMNIIEPIWDRLFIYDTYACRKGKGTHAGVNRTTEFLRAAEVKWGAAVPPRLQGEGGVRVGHRVFCFQGDISKCFPSINHHILMRIIEQKIKCKDTLRLFDKIIFNGGDHANPDSHNLPIGNLVSQWAANLYLSELDYFVKHHLKVKFYVRYMDDFILLSNDKGKLHAHRRAVEVFLWEKLRMKLNPKSDIYPVSQGIDFLGYRIWSSHRLLRKISLYRATKRFKKLSGLYSQGRVTMQHVKASVMSWLGHCVHANAGSGVKICLQALKLTAKNL